MKTENKPNLELLEQNDLRLNKESTTKILEDYNTPLDFSSKKRPMKHPNISSSFSYLFNHNNRISLSSDVDQTKMDEREINYLNNHQNGVKMSSMGDMKNTNETIFLDVTNFENMSTSIQNGTNPFSIDRLISKQTLQ